MNDQSYNTDDMIVIAQDAGDPVYNSFSDLPWIVAVAAMAAVGGISYYNLNDFWLSFERACLAFAVFWSLGSFVRKFLETPPKKSKETVKAGKINKPEKKGSQSTPAGLNLSSDEPESNDNPDDDKE